MPTSTLIVKGENMASFFKRHENSEALLRELCETVKYFLHRVAMNHGCFAETKYYLPLGDSPLKGKHGRHCDIIINEPLPDNRYKTHAVFALEWNPSVSKNYRLRFTCFDDKDQRRNECDSFSLTVHDFLSINLVSRKLEEHLDAYTNYEKAWRERKVPA